MTDIRLELLNIKPISINVAYYRNGNLKTATRQYRYKFLKALLPYQKQLKAFSEAFDHTKHVVGLNILIQTPKHRFFTKSLPTRVNAQGGDAGNYEKLITDFLTSPKYTRDDGKYIDEPMSNVNIDDKHVKAITIDQEPQNNDKWNLILHLEIIEYRELYPWMFNKKGELI